eukprot:UN23954
MVYYSHPDDDNQALFPRICVVMGLFLACMSVLALPFDVSLNADSLDDGGIKMYIVWNIIGITIALFMVVVIPYAFFFYESENDPEKNVGLLGSQACKAFYYTLAFFVVFLLILLILYFIDHEARIPVTVRTYKFKLIQGQTGSNVAACTQSVCSESDETLDIEMGFEIFIIAVAMFLGWFLFTIFVGVGLVAMPMDMINEWRHRPQQISRDEFQRVKRKIGAKAKKLKEHGEELKKEELKHIAAPPSRKVRKEHEGDLTAYENLVYMLRKDWVKLDISYRMRGGNPLIPFSKLCIGIVGASMSLTWFLHICIFMLPPEPAHPFLNNLFIGLDPGGFSLFGLIAFTFQVMWLFFCVIKGAFRLGLRIPYIIRIYPMELGGTLMNAFLVNTWIVLICALPTVSFCAFAFPIYARNTEVDLLFNTYIKYIKFFGYFFRIIYSCMY